MWFGYLQTAIEENWLHDSLVAVLQAIHAQVDGGGTRFDWPLLVSSVESINSRRAELEHRTGLRDRFQEYWNALCGLSPEERIAVSQSLSAQNQIDGLLAGSAECVTIDDLPDGIRNAITRLFRSAFTLLTRLKIRDRLYSEIYDDLPHKVCPFCGLETFDAPGAPREDLDHYLPLTLYPFAAANLGNLVPMGAKCNQRFKGETNLLWDKEGRRRRAFYPYGTIPKITVKLKAEALFEGGSEPRWTVHLHPDLEEVRTWDQVFRVRERIERDWLGARVEPWLRGFGKWARRMEHSDLARMLSDYREIASESSQMGGDFLKDQVFEELLQHYNAGAQAIRRVLERIVFEGADHRLSDS